MILITSHLRWLVFWVLALACAQPALGVQPL